MARDLSCESGRKAYRTKRAALQGLTPPKGEAFVPLEAVTRCHRCRWWHRADDKVRRGGGTRK